jgi:predicted transcriptional regulator
LSQPLPVLKAAEAKRKIAWEMHINGATQWDIAAELGCSQPRVCQFIKQAAKQNPVVALSYEERAALAEAKWNQVEHEIRDQIQEQRSNGRIVREVIRFPDGKEQVKITKEEGVDPSLLRTLSTHVDRRNRQAQNQLSPDAGVQAVQVNVVRDFLQQGDTAGKLSAEEWNKQAIDV